MFLILHVVVVQSYVVVVVFVAIDRFTCLFGFFFFFAKRHKMQNPFSTPKLFEFYWKQMQKCGMEWMDRWRCNRGSRHVVVMWLAKQQQQSNKKKKEEWFRVTRAWNLFFSRSIGTFITQFADALCRAAHCHLHVAGSIFQMRDARAPLHLCDFPI